ncbi:MAG: DUF58 domain-containing protein [Gammaproteobacteria bacterium]|jgi:uncharacterized protein (DUF58 family)|nr:DUF58 domain-containing protein [Gammaproteobacteria bacterium]
MTDLAALRSQAEILASSLPALAFRSTASEAPHVGSAGRRRAGTGEHFWQYRRYAREDDAARVDWRRSARGDELYVRESELETARTVLFWCDPHPGFDWRGSDERRTKADEARMLMLAIGTLLSRDGDRIGVLGSGRSPGFGRRAVDRLAEDLLTDQAGDFPEPPRKSATLIVASDFYDPVETWEQRLMPLASLCREGILLAVADPVELDFPFEGRMRLSRPGEAVQRIFGRAQTLREAYKARLKENREKLKALATRMDWRFVDHDTSKVSLAGAAALKRALETYGGGN